MSLGESEESTEIPGLRYTATPPVPTFVPVGSGTPFVIVVKAPESLSQGTPFTVTVQGFNGQGNALEASLSGVTVTSVPALETATATQSTGADGRVTFEGLVYPLAASGSAILKVAATGTDAESFLPKALPAPFFTTVERVSVDSSGTQSGGNSFSTSISADGRFVAFDSYAPDLVSGDTNGSVDVFVHDRQTGATTRISVNSAGGQSDGLSTGPSLSADGRFVAFASDGTNLVSGDTNGDSDIFVRDRETGTTTRISVTSAGAQSNGGFTTEPSISADGRFVAFTFSAGDLVLGDTNGFRDVFVVRNPFLP